MFTPFKYGNFFAIFFLFFNVLAWCAEPIDCEAILGWHGSKKEELKSFVESNLDPNEQVLALNLSSKKLENRRNAIGYFANHPKYKETLIPIYEAVLADPLENRIIREYALNALVSWGAESCLHTIEHELNSPSTSLQASAIRALARLGGAKEIELIRTALKASHASVRQAAMDSLAKLQDQFSIPEIELQLGDSSQPVQNSAMNALIDLHSTVSSKKLIPFLNSKTQLLRSTAIRGLGILGEKEDIKWIQPFLKKEGPDQTVAITALAILGDTSSKPKIESLAKVYGASQNSAIQALGLLKSSDSIPLLQQLALKNSVASDVLAYSFGDITYHNLYRAIRSDESFFDQNRDDIPIKEFQKTGSRTLLLGGKLAGKVVIRIMPKSQFEQWSLALNKVGFWKKEGFKQAPIEPIFEKNEITSRFNLSNLAKQNLETLVESISNGNYGSDMVPVFTKVLGPTMKSYLNVVDAKFAAEANRQRGKIIDVLRWDFAINHGHPHTENFCIEIVEGVPRLFLIDFDSATNFSRF